MSIEAEKSNVVPFVVPEKKAEVSPEDGKNPVRALFDQRLNDYENNHQTIESVGYEDIRVGEEVSEIWKITPELIKLNGIATTDTNPIHMDEDFARKTKFGGVIMHGVFTLEIISKLLGTKLPGTGTIFAGLDDIRFLKPVKPGDTLKVYVRVAEKQEKGKVLFTVGASVGTEDVVTGKALVVAPRETRRPQVKPEKLAA